MTPASTEKFDFTQKMKTKETQTQNQQQDHQKTTSQEESPDRKRKTTPGLDSPPFFLFLVVWILFSVCSCFDCFLVFWSYILCAVELKKLSQLYGIDSYSIHVFFYKIIPAASLFDSSIILDPIEPPIFPPTGLKCHDLGTYTSGGIIIPGVFFLHHLTGA